MASFIPLNTKPLRRIARMMRVAALAALLAPAGCAYWAAPIEGRVVDADTGEPVEDAVIAAIWIVKGGLEGGVPQCPVGLEDAVTGPQGRYRIEGWGPRLPGGSVDINAPRLYYFKDGYRLAIESTDRVGHHGDVPLRIKSDQDGETIALERYEGAPEDYHEALRQFGTPIRGYNGCECEWEKIPHYTAAFTEFQRAYYGYAFDNFIKRLHGNGQSYQCADPRTVLPLSSAAAAPVDDSDRTSPTKTRTAPESKTPPSGATDGRDGGS